MMASMKGENKMAECIWHTCLLCANPDPELYPGGICPDCRAKHKQRESGGRLWANSFVRDEADSPRDRGGPAVDADGGGFWNW